MINGVIFNFIVVLKFAIEFYIGRCLWFDQSIH